MILIAGSGSTHTDWALVDRGQVVERAETAGLNPYFHTRREISHIIRLELPENFFKTKLERVYFYGSGCANPDKNKVVESSLVAQFRTPTEVHSDLLGSCRGMLQHNPGLVALISTGTNSCFYDGVRIVKNVLPCGYILGDEGSGSYMGKLLLSDVLKELVPPNIITRFYDDFKLTPDQIMDMVYTHPRANNTLAQFTVFLKNHLDLDYCRKLVYDSFLTFFRRNITAYDYEKYPLCITGGTACNFRHLLEQAAEEFGVKIAKIEPSAIEGLVQYHS